MAISVSEYKDVRKQLQEFGCDVPVGFTILPINFEVAESPEDFKQVTAAATIRKLFRSANLPLSEIAPLAQRPPYSVHRSLDWMAPALFLSASLVAENFGSVLSALEVIKNYVMESAYGVGGRKKMKLDIVIEQSDESTCKKISYEGPAEQLGCVADIIHTVVNDEQ